MFDLPMVPFVNSNENGFLKFYNMPKIQQKGKCSVSNIACTISSSVANEPHFWNNYAVYIIYSCSLTVVRCTLHSLIVIELQKPSLLLELMFQCGCL